MSLKQLVNNKHLYEDFLEEIDERIEQTRKALEQASDVETMYRMQGAIGALRKLKTLKEKVNG